MGEVVEVGREVKKVQRGDRVVVPSFICCGNCWYCKHDEWSLCDNTNPNAQLQEAALGYPTAGIYGYTHAFGGYAGSHANFVRVPHADVDCFKVPEGLTDEQPVLSTPRHGLHWRRLLNSQRGTQSRVVGAEWADGDAGRPHRRRRRASRSIGSPAAQARARQGARRDVIRDEYVIEALRLRTAAAPSVHRAVGRTPGPLRMLRPRKRPYLHRRSTLRQSISRFSWWNARDPLRLCVEDNFPPRDHQQGLRSAPRQSWPKYRAICSARAALRDGSVLPRDARFSRRLPARVRMSE